MRRFDICISKIKIVRNDKLIEVSNNIMCILGYTNQRRWSMCDPGTVNQWKGCRSISV